MRGFGAGLRASAGLPRDVLARVLLASAQRRTAPQGAPFPHTADRLEVFDVSSELRTRGVRTNAGLWDRMALLCRPAARLCSQRRAAVDLIPPLRNSRCSFPPEAPGPGPASAVAPPTPNAKRRLLRHDRGRAGPPTQPTKDGLTWPVVVVYIPKIICSTNVQTLNLFSST